MEAVRLVALRGMMTGAAGKGEGGRERGARGKGEGSKSESCNGRVSYMEKGNFSVMILFDFERKETP